MKWWSSTQGGDVFTDTSVQWIGRTALNNKVVLSYRWDKFRLTLSSSSWLPVPAATICPVRSSLCPSQPATRSEPRRTEESWSAGASEWQFWSKLSAVVFCVLYYCTCFTTQILIRTLVSWVKLLLVLLFHFQPAVDGGRLQQCSRLSLQVLRPLALQTVPRRRGGQRRRSQRHLRQL